MRIFVIAVGLGTAACAREAAKVDTASARDSTVVAGSPAVPVSQTPPETAKTPPAKTRPADAGVPAAKTAPPATGDGRADSVRGIVSVVGTSFDKHVMIAVRGNQRRVEVVGPMSALIGHVAGAEITAFGGLSGTRLTAARFVVRSVDGQPAIDGTLRTEGGALFIVTSEGARMRIAAPPPPLVGQDGARVWITGDPAKSVSSFGFIDPPR